MNTMELINQPLNGQLGNRLIELLDSSKYDALNITVAFAKNSGVLRIKPFLDKFREKGGIVNAYIGIDLGGTSYEALIALFLCTDSLSVIHSESSQTFHSKVYQFLGKNEGLLVVGSHNLTAGGLWTNFESSALIPIDMTKPHSSSIVKAQTEYFSALASLDKLLMPIHSKDDIDKLYKRGYITNEVKQQVYKRDSNKSENHLPKLFGNGYSTSLPSITPTAQNVNSEQVEKQFPNKELTKSISHLKDYSKTIWFETKRMTGGSRNILDLSKRSLVERGDPRGTIFSLGLPELMRGGVEFFGINADQTNIEKNITLNFEGVDYVNNTILYPKGESANGTWRLQIKGTDSNGVKITDAFRNKGETDYLVQKIVTFSRVSTDYYFLSVFPETDILLFENASRILARNGSSNNARRLGLL